MLSPIFESFNQDRARSGNTDMCVNLYPDIGADQKINLLVNCPGLTAPLATVGAGPVRGLWPGANGVLYVASGANLYRVDSAWMSTLIGAIGTSSGPVFMADNPTQVQVVDGAAGWLITKSSNALSQNIPQVNVSATKPSMVVYQDGFGLINSTDNQAYQSGYNDLSLYATGGTANNAFIQGNPQNLVTLFELKGEVWFFKQSAIEVWANQGNAGFAFAPLQGVSIPVGCAAAASVARLGEGLVWLGRDEQGQAVVYQSVGYQAKPISPPGLSALFQTYTTVSDAIAYSYQSAGHYFYVLTFPTANATWAYDSVTGKWHQRGYFSNGALGRELANCHCLFQGNHVVGDYKNGNLYALDDGTYTDNGTPRKWLRSWRALVADQPQGVPMSFDELQVLLETGITAASGTDPQVTLRWSDDGGYTWPGQVLMSAGKIGETARRVIARRMGSTKIGTGLDRIWEISSTDPLRIAISGASWEGGPS